MNIGTKTEKEIRVMAEGGKILAKVMEELEKMVRPGITTKELDRAAEALILKLGAACAFKGYQDKDDKDTNSVFPACLCVSVNDEVVHCPPSERILKEGDIVSLDLGVLYKGFYADMAITAPVGRISPIAAKLIKVTKEALKRGIKKVKVGGHFGDIGSVIQKHVEDNGFSVVRDLCGHGIGRGLHEEPQVLNYAEHGTGLVIQEGMVFCIEPITAAGDWKIKKAGLGYKTIDNSLSAHFEHTLAINKNGCQVLTKIS